MQLTARHTAHLWQQYQDLPQQQHLLPLELPDAHNAPGWSQEQFLQQRRRMQQQGEQQQQRRQARGQRQAEQQEQEGQQQQQELLAWHDDSWQVQQLLELSGVWPGSSRHHAVAEHQLNQQQRAAEQRQALSALQVIEHELQQLFTMHDWLAQTHATAAPGSRAAVACASALLQHQQVLQQALEAREALEAAALEATAALVASGGPPRIAAGSSAGGICMQPRGLEAAGMGGAALELDSSHINCLEEGEPLYPVDGAEVLLQHFGHFAII
jgi:hypothetical protein